MTTEIIIMWAAVTLYAVSGVGLIVSYVFKKPTLVTVALVAVAAGVAVHATAIGIPATVVRINGSKVRKESEALDQRDYPDLVHQQLAELAKRVCAMEVAEEKRQLAAQQAAQNADGKAAGAAQEPKQE